MSFMKIPQSESKTAPKTVEYVVQPGDTLFSLAVRFNTSASCLRVLNARQGCHLPLLPGTVLHLPATALTCNWFTQDANGPNMQLNLQDEQQDRQVQQASLVSQFAERSAPEKPKTPAAAAFNWSMLARPSSIEEAQSLGWTFLDAEREERIQPGRSKLALPRLLVPPQSSTAGPCGCLLADELLLTPTVLRSIVEVLPARAEGLDLCMLFNSGRHGHSLRTLYELSSRAGLDASTCGLLVAALDDGSTLLGAILPCPLRPPSLNGCYGTGETQVFRCRRETDCQGKEVIEFSVYSATGADSVFINSRHDCLSIGSGALTIRSDLLSGCSLNCQTFGSPALAETAEFKLTCVQLWVFEVMEKN